MRFRVNSDLERWLPEGVVVEVDKANWKYIEVPDIETIIALVDSTVFGICITDDTYNEGEYMITNWDRYPNG